MTPEIDKWLKDASDSAFSELNNSIGYYESSHKDEVTKGAKILWMKLEPRLRELLQLMAKNADSETAGRKAAHDELKTIADILRRH